MPKIVNSWRIIMKDSYQHKGMRRRMVKELRDMGISDESILSVMMELPRHFFIAEGFEEWAYKNQPFSIGYEQTISQPYTVARQTELLQIQRDMKVLEIGTGSGYQAAVLHLLGAKVFTIERQEGLYKKTKELLSKLGFHAIRCYLKDGYKGLPEYAPFDRILVTAGAREIPKPLLDQLSIGGKLVIPVGETAQEMKIIEHTSAGIYHEITAGSFKFVPLLPGINPA
jgi:protein-L-isoaspartate(D-aspartate) O-methyltransferase